MKRFFAMSLSLKLIQMISYLLFTSNTLIWLFSSSNMSRCSMRSLLASRRVFWCFLEPPEFCEVFYFSNGQTFCFATGPPMLRDAHHSHHWTLPCYCCQSISLIGTHHHFATLPLKKSSEERIFLLPHMRNFSRGLLGGAVLPLDRVIHCVPEIRLKLAPRYTLPFPSLDRHLSHGPLEQILHPRPFNMDQGVPG